MTRRLFYIALGASAGVLLVRRAQQAAARYTPAHVQHRLTESAGGLSGQVREFLEQVRSAAAEREAELRTALGLDGTHDAVDAGL